MSLQPCVKPNQPGTGEANMGKEYTMTKTEKAEERCFSFCSADGSTAIVGVDGKSSLFFFEDASAEAFKRCVNGLKAKSNRTRVLFYRDILRDCSLANLNRLFLEIIKP